MTTPAQVKEARRRLLWFILQSPLAVCGAVSAFARGPGGRPSILGSRWRGASGTSDPLQELIRSPEEALDVFDFKALAKTALPPAHYGYLATGVDGEETLRANRLGFRRYALRVRRLVDVRHIDTSVELLGRRWETPIFLCPAGSQKAFHEEGEVAAARAAKAKRHLMILSTVSTSSVEEVTQARGGPVWFQLYPTTEWSITRVLLDRAEAAGCPVVVLTVDLQGGSHRESLRRFEGKDPRDCSACHRQGPAFQRYLESKPMFRSLDVSGATGLIPRGMTWSFLRRLKAATSMKLVVKGIVTGEDALLAVDSGADGIIVSNHGGRAEESGRSTIESLPEVIAAVRGRVPVLIDGGFRRGTDIFKALALGASAVGVGRPYLWGLAAFGQAGVETVLALLRAELERTMRQTGTVSVDRVSRDFLAESRSNAR